jgi:hypothetical protein
MKAMLLAALLTFAPMLAPDLWGQSDSASDGASRISKVYSIDMIEALNGTAEGRVTFAAIEAQNLAPEELNRRRRDAIDRIGRKLINVIAKFCQERQCDVLLDEASPMPNCVVFARSGADFSQLGVIHTATSMGATTELFTAARKNDVSLEIISLYDKAYPFSASVKQSGSQNPNATPTAQSQGQPGTSNPPDITAMGQSARSKKVQLSRDDVGKIATAQPVDFKSVQEKLQHCNNDGYRWNYSKDTNGNEITWKDAGSECGFLAEWALKSLGADNAQVELAFQRACFLPDTVTSSMRAHNYCAELGDLYAQRGVLDVALSVYQQAPNCNLDFTNSPSPAYYATLCLAGEEKIFASRNDTARERSVVSQLCTKYSIYEACSRLNQLGGSVDLNAVQASNDAANEANEERIEANNKASQERQQQHDENFKAVVNAIQSIPTGSGSTPTSNANQQQSVKHVPAATPENTTATQQAEQAPDVRDMTQCVKIESVNFGVGVASNNLTAIKVVFTNTCNQTIRATASALETGKSCVMGGATTMLAPGSSYTFLVTTDRNWYQVQADDGVDCYSSGRPSCALQIPHSC